METEDSAEKKNGDHSFVRSKSTESSGTMSVFPVEEDDTDDDELGFSFTSLGGGLGNLTKPKEQSIMNRGNVFPAKFTRERPGTHSLTALLGVERESSDEEDNNDDEGGGVHINTSEDEEEEEDFVGPPLRLMRNVSGYDVREDRLNAVRCNSLVTGSEPHFFRLMAASMNGDLLLLQRMLTKMSMMEIAQLNPVKDSPTYGLNPLHVARSVDAVSALLSHGVNIDIEGLNGQTPLHTHTHNNRPRIIKYLLEHGAKVDAQTKYNGSTPLQWAVAADNLIVVRILVTAGANVQYQNFSGNTALHMVQSVSVARFLVEHGARIDVTNDEGRLPLEEAANRAVDDSQLDVALYLLDLSRRTYFSRGSQDEPEVEEEAVVNDRVHADAIAELETYQAARTSSAQRKLEQVFQQKRAKERWQLLKEAFISGGCEEPSSEKDGTNGSFLEGSTSGEEFYATFFEVMVKERPALALKVLDKQRTFLYWENDSRIFSYNTSLLGTIPKSSFAVKEMVFYDQAELISHPVVQYMLNLRWVLYTREVVFFEFLVHVVFLALLLLTTLVEPHYIDFSVLSPEVLGKPKGETWKRLLLILANALLAYINVRYIKIQVMQAKLSGMLSGTGNSLSRVLHSRLRNEPYYLVPHVFVLLSQVLRCVPNQPELYVIADVLIALTSPQLFYRALSFGEAHKSIGVPLCTIRSMIASNLIYFVLVFVLISGFSHSMHLLFRGENSPQYGTFTMSWITLFFFAFNLDVESLNEETQPHRKYFGFFTIGVYMFIVSLVTFQLICAVMTNKYEEIYANSKQQYLLQKARLILFYEQYELAQTSLMYSGFAEHFEQTGDLFLPAGESRHFVKELADGTVLLEVPRAYIDQCVDLFTKHGKAFHVARFWLFRTWKRLRRSKSFMFPDPSDSSTAASSSSETTKLKSSHESLSCGTSSTQYGTTTIRTSPGWVPKNSFISQRTDSTADEQEDQDEEDSDLLESAAQALHEKSELVLVGCFMNEESRNRGVPHRNTDEVEGLNLVAQSKTKDQQKLNTTSAILGLASSPSLSRASPSMMTSPVGPKFPSRSVSISASVSKQPGLVSSTTSSMAPDHCKQCKTIMQTLKSLADMQREMANEISLLRNQLQLQQNKPQQ